MVIISTRTVDVIIHAVSPALSFGSSAASAGSAIMTREPVTAVSAISRLRVGFISIPQQVRKDLLLQRIGIGLASANANGFLYRPDKYFAVADLTGLCSSGDDFGYLSGEF